MRLKILATGPNLSYFWPKFLTVHAQNWSFFYFWFNFWPKSRKQACLSKSDNNEYSKACQDNQCGRMMATYWIESYGRRKLGYAEFITWHKTEHTCTLHTYRRFTGQIPGLTHSGAGSGMAGIVADFETKMHQNLFQLDSAPDPTGETAFPQTS